MPRFKHCTISFRRMRDIIPQIRKWFNQQSAKRYQELIFCQEDSGDLNLQNITILIVKAINDHEDDPAPSEIDAEEPDSTDEELIEEDGLLEEETESPSNRLITLELFRDNTMWFNYNPQAHRESMCTIYQEGYNSTSRISSLASTYIIYSRISSSNSVIKFNLAINSVTTSRRINNH
ncbi:hypothetical protein BDEG_24601 [Batrachochytrium dendrobatidis JEL423]|uniref:Uncharacterized protein n=1 Tax=Batrachochytrium dendrobatidis (strain JEL423) TaxID=403673 RepID=A0A177WLD1_BATDL|nr:hypothetical protein BDEG_24601 [Batrachochytrium dendrobatidis JEL423]